MIPRESSVGINDVSMEITPVTKRTSSVTVATPGSSSSAVSGASDLLLGRGTNGALSGRTRRKRIAGHRKRRKRSFLERCCSSYWNGMVTQFGSLALAVVLWYSLGVLSIGSSKLLLTVDTSNPLFGGIPPLLLTFQQLLIGSALLRVLLAMKVLSSPGSGPSTGTSSSTSNGSPMKRPSYYYGERDVHSSPRGLLPRGDYHFLTLAGVYFCAGFLATNYGFSGSSAAFVETIKAAEPITSAIIAVLWGIESLSRPEVISLALIVTGVLLSTLGNHHSDLSSNNNNSNLSESARACLVVMAANLCFSFRGLYQKLFRATHQGGSVDDLNLQFRMQQLGWYCLALPTVVLTGRSVVTHWFEVSASDEASSLIVRYLLWSVVNGAAFASYNLASTYILTRISVVHHAALNCVRRIFAIIVTSILFAIPITVMGALGIVLSFLGFMSFTHFKVHKQRPPKPVTSLLPLTSPKS